MAKTTLQKLHKAMQDHAKSAERERRQHDSRIYDIGRMVEEAGLFDVEELAFKGMLAICAEEFPKMREKWIARGVKAAKPNDEEVKWPARATFPKKVSLPKHAR